MDFAVNNGDGLARLVSYIGAHPHPFRCTVLAGADRTKDQNALAFKWYAEIARDLPQYDASSARAECKLDIGIRMLHAENEQFREQWNRLIRDRYTYEEKLELMLPPHDYPVTRIMTAKQMTRFLDEIRLRFSAQGVRLTIPEQT